MAKPKKGGRWQVIKTYGHNLGFSCAFRQWRAKSHCRFLHGYSIQVELTFETTSLDDRNWVIDFGDLQYIKHFLENMLDHKTVVAKDDPDLGMFKDMKVGGLIDLVVIPHVGCEKFAEFIHDNIQGLMPASRPGVKLVCVEVREHGANAARYWRA